MANDRARQDPDTLNDEIGRGASEDEVMGRSDDEDFEDIDELQDDDENLDDD